MTRSSLLSIVTIVAASGAPSLGCDEKPDHAASPDAQSAQPSSPGAAAPQGAAPEGAAAPPSAGAAASVAVPGAGSGECLKGTWAYDFSDLYIESVAANMPDLKVLKKEGSMTCSLSDNQRGILKCSGGKDGVRYQLESKAAGMPMLVDIAVSGSSSSEYEIVEGNRMRITKSDLGDLKVETSLTLAGKKLPVPVFDMFRGMDKPGSEFELQCEGNALSWKPMGTNLKTDWAHLKRVR